jgi:hypothetical protein
VYHCYPPAPVTLIIQPVWWRLPMHRRHQPTLFLHPNVFLAAPPLHLPLSHLLLAFGTRATAAALRLSATAHRLGLSATASTASPPASRQPPRSLVSGPPHTVRWSCVRASLSFRLRWIVNGARTAMGASSRCSTKAVGCFGSAYARNRSVTGLLAL